MKNTWELHKLLSVVILLHKGFCLSVVGRLSFVVILSQKAFRLSSIRKKRQARCTTKISIAKGRISTNLSADSISKKQERAETTRVKNRLLALLGSSLKLL